MKWVMLALTILLSAAILLEPVFYKPVEITFDITEECRDRLAGQMGISDQLETELICNFRRVK